MFLNRLKCHFCGIRSTHSKGSTRFQCTTCEAWNFFDQDGNVIDAPASVVAQQEAPATTALHAFMPVDAIQRVQSQQPLFCNVCLSNQRIVNEALANYLPDEDHPEYLEYERKLPQHTVALEKRYPQICQQCAPKVQETIHKSDYYSLSQHSSRLMRGTASRKRAGEVWYSGMRDDAGKQRARLLLNAVKPFVYGSLLPQMVWHGSAVLSFASRTAQHGWSGMDEADWSSNASCMGLTTSSRDKCDSQFTEWIPTTFLVAILTLWYSPGIALKYHHTIRVEYVTGQQEYFCLQVISLSVRVMAYFNLTDDATVSQMTRSQLLGAHGFMFLFILLAHLVSRRVIGYVPWTIKGKMMPRPEVEDVFGALAGPAKDHTTPRPSTSHPLHLFARDEKPFPIANLAPKANRPFSSTYANPTLSPPDSPFTDDQDNQMDWQPSQELSRMPGAPVDRTFRPRNTGSHGREPRSTYNHGSAPSRGWNGMRNEIFDIDAQARNVAEQKRLEEDARAKLRYQPPVDPSPFRGRLPQAPMSMERKLRNPPTQLSFKKQPASKQHDFMNQMRQSFATSRTFGPEPRHLQATDAAQCDPDCPLSPPPSPRHPLPDLPQAIPTTPISPPPNLARAASSTYTTAAGASPRTSRPPPASRTSLAAPASASTTRPRPPTHHPLPRRRRPTPRSGAPPSCSSRPSCCWPCAGASTPCGARRVCRWHGCWSLGGISVHRVVWRLCVA